ncbi:MAG: hypothetical protein EOO42_00540 [Flavobacteriales bacterium]|nr:MAG: hypothetical protein EOO42_00540 [Flavobacteriales bacterium]
MIIFLYSLGFYDGNSSIKVAVISGALLLVMLYLLISSLLQLKNKNPLITLDEHSFAGTTTPLARAFGVGYWEDVKHIELVKVGGDTLVSVTLTNTSTYQNRLSNMLYKMAHDERSGTLNIMYSSSEVSMDERQLLELFNSYWHRK